MAYWQRKSGKYVFVYVWKEGKQQPLPRRQTKHLDGMTESQINSWVINYGLQFEKLRVNPDSINYSDSNLSSLVSQFEKHRLLRKKNPIMVRNQTKLLLDYAIPYFLSQQTPLKDPNQWSAVSAKLLTYLESKQLPAYSIIKLNIALKKFWEWLEEEGVIVVHQRLRLRKPQIDKASTPLQDTFAPEDIFEQISKMENHDYKLITLLGYFFSLRPFEIFGLKPTDFAGGQQASFLECCKTMEKNGLFNRLAVKIDRQRIANGNITAPKTLESTTWVACFDQQAAQMIVNYINERSDSEFLLDNWKPDYYIKRWKQFGIANTVTKDLRRSSLYYLGHKTNLGMVPISLQHHARHTKIDTTMLYCRRPNEDLQRASGPLTL